ncbi:hypothetical protein LR48_Vigan01g054600 [Vigna angularis]|uniref:Uncharacterized protein n=1 Tax=Phaseolus angularis TaxID=3914 RepID=A0A0L9TKJ0_PHAAN|nr:hypothetical protein LR48_Vigan01g054600 [Vigna angularis]
MFTEQEREGVRNFLQDIMKGKKEVKMGMDVEKNSLQDIKKAKKSLDGGENSINWEEEREEDTIDNNGTRKGEEEPLFLWVEGVELFTFEGNGNQGQTTRATNVFEVQNIKISTKVHPTVNNMGENAVQGFKTWQQKSKNLSWEDLSKALCRS